MASRSTRFMDKLRQTVASAFTQKSKDAMGKFQTFINKVKNIQVSGNDIMSDKDRLRNPPMKPEYIGKLMMYYYDPKWKDELPYYDMFPLIVPLEIYKDGWLGMNLHYLPPGHRAVLMDMLYNDAIYKPKNKITDQKRLRMTYADLKRISTNDYYKPCIKRYLYKSKKGTHLKSRFYMVPVEDWDTFIFLPFERFVINSSHKAAYRKSKQSKAGYVHRQSAKIIRGRR